MIKKANKINNNQKIIRLLNNKINNRLKRKKIIKIPKIKTIKIIKIINKIKINNKFRIIYNNIKIN